MKWESVEYVENENAETLTFSNTDMKFFIDENYDHTRFEISVKCHNHYPILSLWWFYTKEEAKEFVENFIKEIKKAE